MKTYPVSTVIPCYRCRTTITRAVESVAAQTFRPEELILVEDGSGEENSEVFNALKKKYGDWVKIIKLSNNVGAASARNVGWNLAAQPYIAFLDSDDARHPQKIEIQYQYMFENPDVVISGHLFKELSNEKMGELNWPVKLKSVRKISWIQLLLKNQFVTPSVMVKKDISFRFSEGTRHMEDHRLWLEIVSEKFVAVRLDIELAAIFKPIFGDSGLSANMWSMEKAELSNYQYLYKRKKISLFQYVFLQCFSGAKFIRRLFIVYVVRRVALRWH